MSLCLYQINTNGYMWIDWAVADKKKNGQNLKMTGSMTIYFKK